MATVNYEAALHAMLNDDAWVTRNGWTELEKLHINTHVFDKASFEAVNASSDTVGYDPTGIDQLATDWEILK